MRGLSQSYPGGAFWSFQSMNTSEKRDNDGFRYEEQVIALIFLRCLRKDLPDFKLTSDCLDVGKFDDVVVKWERNSDKYALLVQLKHKTSKDMTAVKKSDLFPPGDNKPDFSIYLYQESYRCIKKDLSGMKHTLVLSTNLPLHENAEECFEERETGSVEGAELMKTGGCILQLDPEEVACDPDFMKHFFLFCSQKRVNRIKDDICKELGNLLGSPESSEIESACEELCKCVMEWKDGQCKDPEYLTSSWSKWKDIERRYKSTPCSIL